MRRYTRRVRDAWLVLTGQAHVAQPMPTFARGGYINLPGLNGTSPVVNNTGEPQPVQPARRTTYG